MCFFTDPATPAISTLSLHDALPICGIEVIDHDLAGEALDHQCAVHHRQLDRIVPAGAVDHDHIVLAVTGRAADRKSTRLNSSHLGISYAVFCLKKKKKKIIKAHI